MTRACFAGRAETATDPAPLEMFETTIRFKPREQWRPGMTMARLVEELDRTVRVPSLSNIWAPPIRNRIDMLATGIKSPVGVKLAGPDLATIERLAAEVKRAVKAVPGVSSALAERVAGGRTIDRARAARFGLNIADVQDVVEGAIGGQVIGETVEGLQRFSIKPLPDKEGLSMAELEKPSRLRRQIRQLRHERDSRQRLRPALPAPLRARLSHRRFCE